MTTPQDIAKLREQHRATRTPEERALDAAELTADTLEALRADLVAFLRSPQNLLKK